MSFIHRNNSKRACAARAVLAFTICIAGALSAFGQSAEPLKTIIPVHIDASTGNITVGSTPYPGKNPGMHLLALKRRPNRSHLDAPDLVQDGTFTDATSVNQFLQSVLANTPDALLIVNAVGNFGFQFNAVAATLQKFGANTDLQAPVTESLVFIGNGGRSMGQASQRGGSTQNMDGYLAPDSNGNYTFIQTDYVRYDIGLDGTITIGTQTYTVADSFKNGGCDGSNSFRLVVVDRETLAKLANNTYCTGQSDANIQYFIGDLSGVTSEGALVFISSNGHPIPANWNFGTDGDARIYPLAQLIAKLGGYFETMIYLSPSDTYSLVGAPPPPTGTLGARKRARESSSVYPDSPSGELHGVLARDKRGNWYSPLNADASGSANLGLYEILAQDPVPFPHPANSDELAAYQYISQQLCFGVNCNIRDRYSDDNIDVSPEFRPNRITILR